MYRARRDDSVFQIQSLRSFVKLKGDGSSRYKASSGRKRRKEGYGSTVKVALIVVECFGRVYVYN
jgi:hypothetical protein